MKYNFTKMSIATFLGILSAYLGVVAIPMILILMLVDYGTGIAAAWISGSLSSRKSISGILKKVGYLAVIVVGIICDIMIEYAFSAIGQPISASYAIGLVIIIWLILNECISILENLSEIGVPIPRFLNGIVKRLKVVAEKQLEKTENALPESDDSIDESKNGNTDENPEEKQYEKDQTTPL